MLEYIGVFSIGGIFTTTNSFAPESASVLTCAIIFCNVIFGLPAPTVKSFPPANKNTKSSWSILELTLFKYLLICSPTLGITKNDIPGPVWEPPNALFVPLSPQLPATTDFPYSVATASAQTGPFENLPE